LAATSFVEQLVEADLGPAALLGERIEGSTDLLGLAPQGGGVSSEPVDGGLVVGPCLVGPGVPHRCPVGSGGQRRVRRAELDGLDLQLGSFLGSGAAA